MSYARQLTPGKHEGMSYARQLTSGKYARMSNACRSEGFNDWGGRGYDDFVPGEVT